MADPLGVGLVGLGTIGTGVVRILQEHARLLEERLGFPLRLVRIADLDLETDRGLDLTGVELSKRWQDVVDDAAVEVVVELVGGTGVAREIVDSALRAGKAVVTANKALLAHHGHALYAAAREAGTDVAFEASVGGTIPVLRALREGLCADRVEAVVGIVNGTCNYILTEMEEHGEPYEACLKRAQDLGYAEADPTFDVDGTDSAHKLAILAGLGLGVQARLEDIPTEGIERITPEDIEYASNFGLRIKLLAIARLSDGAVELRVHPTMIPADSVLAGVSGSMNAVQASGPMSGPTLYYGAGAGSLPTASAVVADVMELARARRLGVSGRVPPLGTPALRQAPVKPVQDLEGEYYLRAAAIDRPGVLAAISGALARHGISIGTVVQLERHAAEAVPLVLLTHRAKESALRAALAGIAELGDVRGRVQVIRIEREL